MVGLNYYLLCGICDIQKEGGRLQRERVQVSLWSAIEERVGSKGLKEEGGEKGKLSRQIFGNEGGQTLWGGRGLVWQSGWSLRSVISQASALE